MVLEIWKLKTKCFNLFSWLYLNLANGAGDLEVKVLPVQKLSRKMRVSKIPLDKKLTAYCLAETRMKFGELILAVMVFICTE